MKLIKLKLLIAIIENDVFQFSKNSAQEIISCNHLQRTNIQTGNFAANPLKH